MSKCHSECHSECHDAIVDITMLQWVPQFTINGAIKHAPNIRDQSRYRTLTAHLKAN